MFTIFFNRDRPSNRSKLRHIIIVVLIVNFECNRSAVVCKIEGAGCWDYCDVCFLSIVFDQVGVVRLEDRFNHIQILFF